MLLLYCWKNYCYCLIVQLLISWKQIGPLVNWLLLLLLLAPNCWWLWLFCAGFSTDLLSGSLQTSLWMNWIELNEWTDARRTHRTCSICYYNKSASQHTHTHTQTITIIITDPYLLCLEFFQKGKER